MAKEQGQNVTVPKILWLVYETEVPLKSFQLVQE
jgi:hypothetical protein